MAQRVAKRSRPDLVDDAIDLLRSARAAHEPGLRYFATALYALEGETEATHRWVLGESDALAENRAPEWFDLLGYYRVLVAMLTKPGERAVQLLLKIARATLRKLAYDAKVDREELAKRIVANFCMRRFPVRQGGLPDLREDLRGVVAQALQYVGGSVKRRAFDEIRAIKGDYLQQVPTGSRIESVSGEADRPFRRAKSELPEGLWSLAAVARTLKRARSTVRKVADELGLPGQIVGTARAFTLDEVVAIQEHLPRGRNRAGPAREPRKRIRDRRRPWPKDAFVFGGDFDPSDSSGKSE